MTQAKRIEQRANELRGAFAAMTHALNWAGDVTNSIAHDGNDLEDEGVGDHVALLRKRIQDARDALKGARTHAGRIVASAGEYV